MNTLERFATGASLQTPHGLNSLIACERISEGIDIKSVDTIVLFSSDQRRLKTIQRIGRALRTDPARPGKIATVVDFIYDDPEHSDIARRDCRSTYQKQGGIWMTEESVIERLKNKIRIEAARVQWSDRQLNELLAVIDEVISGETVSDSRLLDLFELIGSDQE